MKYERPLNCPCILKEKPMCREGVNCWHFGNNKGTCAHCFCTGRMPPGREAAERAALRRSGTE